MNHDYLNLLRSSFDEYLGFLESPLTPDDNYLPYDYPYITEAKWRSLSAMMLKDELREVTNRINEWHYMLRRWNAWNKVVSTKEHSPAWDLRSEFMEPLMRTCLMMPSAMRDLITFVGTNALHQVRLNTEPTYKDFLEGDPSAADPSPRPLTRRKKEDRLASLAAPLKGSIQFIEAVRQIDGKDYRAQTKDYRNLNSHAIGSRIALGSTRMVTRQVVPVERMEDQPDGTVRWAEVPGLFKPRYGLGGMEPLDLEVARKASLGQYYATRTCFDHFVVLLQSHCAKLPRADV